MRMRELTVVAVTVALIASNMAHAKTRELVPLHVSDWAYYGFGGEGDGLAPSWVAEHATYVEAAPPFAQRFKAAGGRYAVAYTDPFRVIPDHHEPLSDLPERAWLHDSSGHRISYQLPGWGLQNQLNPADPQTVAGYKKLTESIRRSAPYDFIEMDDASFDLDNVFWHFSSPGVEVPNEAAYDDGVVTLIKSAALPAFVSGFSNEDRHLDDRSGNVTFLPYAAGAINNEGCLMSTAHKSEKQWSFDQNTLLAVTASRKPAVCWGTSAGSGDTRAQRLFYFASWLLTYDPSYSIAFENFEAPRHVSLFPEEDIVPRDPVQTVQRTVTELKSARGYYAREFRECYQWGKEFGPCVAIVNPTAAPVSIAPVPREYDSQLVVDVHDSAHGGTASWIHARPDKLDPDSGLILRRS